jgi:hypothetical protein
MAAFALALFLIGTHWCLVGAVATHFGARISCMTPLATGSCHGSPTSHCGHSSPARPARGAAPPCCVALAPVVATSLVAVPDDALAPVLAASPPGGGDRSACGSVARLSRHARYRPTFATRVRTAFPARASSRLTQ